MTSRIKILFVFLTLLASTTGIFAFTPPLDYPEAAEFCDKADLRPIEGIWSYPEDEVDVIIFRNEGKKGVYDIFVVQSSDCSLSPGVKLGEMHESSDANKYNMKLFTNIKKGVLSSPMTAVATRSANGDSFTFRKSSGFSLRLNPTRLLPWFWRIISVNIKSGEAAPEGMIKVYPSYDGNNSSRRAPRYL